MPVVVERTADWRPPGWLGAVTAGYEEADTAGTSSQQPGSSDADGSTDKSACGTRFEEGLRQVIMGVAALDQVIWSGIRGHGG